MLAVTDAGQPFSTFTWAHAIGLAPGVEPVRDTRLPYGQVADLNITPAGVALLTGCWGRDPAWWKRYRGGTSGRLWFRPGAYRDAEPGLAFQRLLPEVIAAVKKEPTLTAQITGIFKLCKDRTRGL